MATIYTHPGGPFYEWYVRVYGHPPPATVDSNASRYRAWAEHVPIAEAKAIPFGSFGPPAQFLPGGGILAPVEVITPASPTPVVAPVVTVIEPGVTYVGPAPASAPVGPPAPPEAAPVATLASDAQTYEATAYGPPWGGIQGTGVTATGIDLRDSPHKYIVAVDPNRILLHSHLRITPNPFGDNSIVFAAEDTGGAIKGNRIDFYDWRGRASQLAWGRRQVTVRVVTDAITTPSSAGGAGYFNPLSHASVRAERIDQGVDYAGTGYLVAIADGIMGDVVNNGSGWEGEGYLEYRITQAGFLYGAWVYYAEGVNPVVRKGEQVRGGSRLCDLRQPMPHGIEIGFAAGDGTQRSYYAYHDGKYREGTATRPGLAMSNLIKALGGPGGIIEGEIVGNFPEYLQSGEPPGNLQAGAGGTLGSTQPITASAPTIAAAFDWPKSLYTAFVQLQRGAYYGAHHSHAAQQYADKITYVPKSD